MGTMHTFLDAGRCAALSADHAERIRSIDPVASAGAYATLQAALHGKRRHDDSKPRAELVIEAFRQPAIGATSHAQASAILARVQSMFDDMAAETPCADYSVVIDALHEASTAMEKVYNEVPE